MIRRVLFIAALTIALALHVAPAHAALTYTGPAAYVAQDQTWETQAAAHVWLGNETVNLLTTDLCAGPWVAGCSYPGNTYAVSRDAFYYEIGHQMDWTYLTDTDRAYLAGEWGASGDAWQDTPAGLAAGQEDGLEGVFPYFVEACAEGDGPQEGDTVQAFPDGPTVHVPRRFNICRWINALGARETG
jgi:hypothetical protein